jgi:hypothetical protein
LGGLFEPRRDVDGVPQHDSVGGCEHPPATERAGDHLASVHADPGRDGDLQRLGELGDARLDLERRTARAQRVVLVRLGHAEQTDDRVADELLDQAAMAFEGRPSMLVVRRHQPEQGLRVNPLRQRGRPRQIAEHRGRELPALRRRGSQRGPTVVAEPSTLRALSVTERARGHLGKLARRP